MFDSKESSYSICLKTASSGFATVYLPGINNTNFTTTIQGLTASLDTITNTPVVNPYGFASMPDNTYYTAVVGNLGIRNQFPVVLGYTNGVKTSSPLDIVAGESALYNSTDFSLELKLTEMRARFNGISCKLANGNSIQEIFSDILNEMQLFLTFFNEQVTIFNSHVHDLPATLPLGIEVISPPGGGTCTVTGSGPAIPIPVVTTTPTGPPTTEMIDYAFTEPIVVDTTYVDNNFIFIDNEGEILR